MLQSFQFASIPSTQSLAKELLRRKKPPPILIRAEEQTASYGRFRKPWSSPRGGLWFSLLLGPKTHGGSPSRLGQLAAETLQEVLEGCTGRPVRFKLPNDLLMRHQKTWKKVAGILVETVGTSSRMEGVVLGVGVNVQNPIPPPLRPTATSVRQSARIRICREKLLEEFLRRWFEKYDSFNPLGSLGS